ncbi:MAG TPA: F0F1 ATP synthase subunit delta [Mycobacteriales bacterium]|nr:F0F1 ATP synthase subunit delta [Mycobacteriales bacterium]
MSEQSLAAVQERFDELLEADASALADELFAVVDLLDKEAVLRRTMSDPSAPEQARAGLVDAVLGGQLSAGTVQAMRLIVSQRWSRPADLMEAVETLARRAVLTQAERDGALDEIEDELFRFGRIVTHHTELASLLGDRAAAGSRRRELLDSLLADKVHPTTRQLLDRAVTAPRSTSLDRAIDALCEQAAGRRGRTVAWVRSATVLTPDQERRLASALGRIYRREVAVHTELDPDVVGGLLIQVGDDVIDGTISRQLDEATRGLTG